MIDLFFHLISLLLFDIPLLYCYIHLRSLGICLSNPILSSSFVTASKLICGKIDENFETLSTSFIPIKPPVASAVFLIALFEAVLSGSVADCLA